MTITKTEVLEALKTDEALFDEKMRAHSSIEKFLDVPATKLIQAKVTSTDEALVVVHYHLNAAKVQLPLSAKAAPVAIKELLPKLNIDGVREAVVAVSTMQAENGEDDALLTLDGDDAGAGPAVDALQVEATVVEEPTTEAVTEAEVVVEPEPEPKPEPMTVIYLDAEAVRVNDDGSFTVVMAAAPPVTPGQSTIVTAPSEQAKAIIAAVKSGERVNLPYVDKNGKVVPPIEQPSKVDQLGSTPDPAPQAGLDPESKEAKGTSAIPENDPKTGNEADTVARRASAAGPAKRRRAATVQSDVTASYIVQLLNKVDEQATEIAQLKAQLEQGGSTKLDAKTISRLQALGIAASDGEDDGTEGEGDQA